MIKVFILASLAVVLSGCQYYRYDQINGSSDGDVIGRFERKGK